MNFGENVKKVRNRLGLTQAELAKKMKVSQVTISSYEINLRVPSARFVSKFITMAKTKQIDVKYEDLRPE